MTPIQTASNTLTPGSTSITVTLGAPTTPGSCLVVASSNSGTTNNMTVTGMTLGGSADNFLQQSTVGDGLDSAAITEIWADPNCGSGQTSVVVSYSAAPSTGSVWVYEFPGVALSSILDKSAGAFSTSTQPTFSSGATPTTTQADELWFGANTGYVTTITGPASPWINSTVLNSGNRFLIAGYQVVSSTGTATYSGGYSPDSYETATVVTLKLASGGGSVSGTGAVTLKKMILTGTGNAPVVGTGATKVKKIVATGTGNAPLIGTGATALKKGKLTGTGTVSGSVSGTGATSIKKMHSAGAGSTSPGVVFDSTDGSGIKTYTVSSGLNGTAADGPEPMRVLEPTSPNSNYNHAFLWMLPVEAGQGTTFGDSIGTALSISAHNNYNLTIIQPGVLPDGFWGADNPLDPTISQESFLMALVAWAKTSALATTGTEKHYLIGFSRSGIGAQSIIYRHPTTFEAVASWDFPASMTDFDGTDPIGHMVGGNPDAVYGTSANFQDNYELSNTNLTAWKVGQDYTSVNRIWIGGFNAFKPDVDDYDSRLTSLGILHTYNYQVNETHAWDNDWVNAALGTIVEPIAALGTGATAVKKMTASASGTVSAPGTITGTGASSLHKMTLAGSGSESTSGTGAIRMHKMVAHGFFTKVVYGQSSVSGGNTTNISISSQSESTVRVGGT